MSASIEWLATYKQRYAHEQAEDFLRNIYPWERESEWSQFGSLPKVLADEPAVEQELIARNAMTAPGSFARLRDGRYLWVALKRQPDLRHLLAVFLITPAAAASSATGGARTGGSSGGLPPGAPPANAFAQAFVRLQLRGR